MPFKHRDAVEINPLRCSLVLYKQAIRSLHKNAVQFEYHEVLLRVKTLDGEILPPSRLLAIASQVRGSSLDRQIVSVLLEYLSVSGDQRVFGVNLSAGTIASNGVFFEFLLREVERLQINPRQLVFEINENTAAFGKSEIIQWVDRLQSLGFRFALDDFGSAYLNFLDVKKLTKCNLQNGAECLPSYIKIDCQFVRSLDIFNSFVVRSIAGLATLSNALSVAECVETKEQYLALKEYGVDLVQGYLIEQPQLLYDPPIPVYPRLD